MSQQQDRLIWQGREGVCFLAQTALGCGFGKVALDKVGVVAQFIYRIKIGFA